MNKKVNNILILEDSLTHAHNMTVIIVKALQIDQKNIHRCSDSNELMRIFMQLKPELILLDIFFDKNNAETGLSVLEKLRNAEKTAGYSPLIFIVSSVSDKRIISHAVNRLQADYYFVKPVEESFFKKILTRFFNNYEKRGLK